jgi:galactokinase
MALTDKDILIAVKRQPNTQNIQLANVDQGKFPRREFVFQPAADQYVDIDPTKHEWSNYFKSGLKVRCYPY